MIFDTTGLMLIPGNVGENCPGNGLYSQECCCDECDYLLCCTNPCCEITCQSCADPNCPFAAENTSVGNSPKTTTKRC